MGVVADVAAGAISGGNASRLAREQAAWAALVPSTHHDYITGTAGAQYMDVNAAEQLPRLRLSASLAHDLLGDAIEELRLGINPGTAPNAWATPVVVCNPLGFPRTDLVSLPQGAGIGVVSLHNSSGDQLVQQSADGSLLFIASAPSLDYDTVFVNTNQPSSQQATVSISNSGTTWTLANDLVSVTVDQASQWGITSMSAIGSTTSIIAPGEITPMRASTVAPPPLSSNAYPPTYSLASVSSPSSAILTAAKGAYTEAADLILRIYQPTNTVQSVELTTAVDASGAIVQTALEGFFQFQQPNAAITSAGSGGTTVQMNNALATLRLPGAL